jgi:hypothetical protein
MSESAKISGIKCFYWPLKLTSTHTSELASRQIIYLIVSPEKEEFKKYDHSKYIKCFLPCLYDDGRGSYPHSKRCLR